MKTTLRKIKSFNPCLPGWRTLCEGLGTTDPDTEVSILQILEINGVEDAFWALRTQKYKDYCLVLADIAESVLHIFEEEYPDDKRPRRTIQAIRDYKAGKISKKELEDARTAITADPAAITRATRTAYAAAYTARARVDHTAIDAAEVAYDVAYNAAYAAAYDAIDAAANAAAARAAKDAAAYDAIDAAAYDYNDAYVNQRKKNEKILRSYLKGENHEN